MNPAEAVYKMPIDESEMEYLVHKKNEDVAKQFKILRLLIVIVVIVAVLVGIGMFTITRTSPQTFINSNESAGNILLTCVKLMVGLIAVMCVATYYSYANTLKKVIKDIKKGQKTIEPCLVIRKYYSPENNTCHVYITSNVRLSLEVTKDEFKKLDGGDKIYIEYSTFSKIFFGYFLEKNA